MLREVVNGSQAIAVKKKSFHVIPKKSDRIIGWAIVQLVP